MVSTAMAMATKRQDFAALATRMLHQPRRFFGLTVPLIVKVRRTNFSNPCTRRSDRRNAFGLATFMRRFRTMRPLPSFAKW